jgi:hypothetical protein
MRLHSAICQYAWVLVCNNDVNKAASQLMFSQLIRCRHRGEIYRQKESNVGTLKWRTRHSRAWPHRSLMFVSRTKAARYTWAGGRLGLFDTFARARQVAYLLILFAGLPRFHQQSFKLGTHRQLQCRELPFFIFSLPGRPGEWSEWIFIRLDVR